MQIEGLKGDWRTAALARNLEKMHVAGESLPTIEVALLFDSLGIAHNLARTESEFVAAVTADLAWQNNQNND